MRRPKNRVIRFLFEVVDLYFTKRVSRSAAELAYFLVLTFFPLLICINAIVGALNLSADNILASLTGIVPEVALGVLIEYVGYITNNQSSTLLAAGVVMLLFSASAAMRSLMNIMDDIYGRKAYVGIWQIVASVAFSVLFLLTIYLSLIVVLTGNWFFHLLEQFIHGIPRLEHVTLPWDWQWMRFLLLFCLVLVFVMLLYKATAPRGKPHAPVLIGALLAAAALVGASAIFSIFIGMSSRYSLVYGSLTSVIILLLWLYLCGTIVILGNVINRVWYSHKRAHFFESREERD